MSQKVPEKRYLDSYEFFTKVESKLLDEVAIMEENSRWTPSITSKHLRLESIDGPILAQKIADDNGLSLEIVYDTATEGTKLLLQLGRGQPSKCIRDTARASLYETAKLSGSALGRMHPSCLAETLNNGLFVARGHTLMLERFGKVAALHSDANGGYRIMPISELLQITKKTLTDNFGQPQFIHAYNRHDHTYCLWELPDVQNDIIDKYQTALTDAVSYNHAVNFMPCVSFSSSDTAASSAILMPMFKLPSGVRLRLGDGIQVQHKRSVRAGAKDGVELFEEMAGELFAKFNETTEIIEKMGKTEIWNPVNCLVGICNRLKISRKYADSAREEVERFALNSPCCSFHDIYISLAECIGYAKRSGANRQTILTLEENIAKALTLEWTEFDVGGVVVWGSAA